LIIGFSPTVSYSCNDCNAVCCRTEYKLPLFDSEYNHYSKFFPIVNPFLLKNFDNNSRTSHWLLRTDSCFFLVNNSICSIHSKTGKQLKPLVCQVYPLTFWKIDCNDEQNVLAYLYPCKGLKWVEPIENQIKDINLTFLNVENKFETYFGDQIDLYNPYENIRIERINEAHKNLITLKKNQWNWVEVINTHTHHWRRLGLNNIRDLLFTTLNKSLNVDNNSWLNYLISTYHWLTFNPNLLILEENISTLIRLLAVSWGNEMVSLIKVPFNNGGYPIKNEMKERESHFYEQIAWGMIQIITLEWWEDIEVLIENKFSESWKKTLAELISLKNKYLFSN
jgi:Fe-S-cluster containining protein